MNPLVVSCLLFSVSSLQISGYYLLFLALLIHGKMFFIGGLNSILPYIIYLSIIWVFLIVSFCGKITQAKQLFTPVTYYSDNHALQYYDSKVFHFYSHPTDIQTQTAGKDHTIFPWSDFYPVALKHEPEGHDMEVFFEFHYYSFYDFRGPPAAKLFI
jgi:hypothetical protein